MKKKLLLFIMFPFLGFTQETAIEILKKTSAELNRISHTRYKSVFEAVQTNSVYRDTSLIFFDFETKNNHVVPKYHINNKFGNLIYDGNRHIQSLDTEKIIIVNEAPHAKNPLLLSLYAIRKLLPDMLKSENLEIKTNRSLNFKEEKTLALDIKIENARIDWENMVIVMNSKASSKFKLYIDESKFLPKKIEIENGSAGSISKTFESFDFNYLPDDNFWKGLNMPKNYKKITWMEYHEMMSKKR